MAANLCCRLVDEAVVVREVIVEGKKDAEQRRGALGQSVE
jgi:hypothetical protein